MNVVREIERLNEEELKTGLIEKASWHDQYKNSSWIYAGGLNPAMTEGDVLCVFSQWGEIEDINLVRDKETGKSMGFAFIKYEDRRSSILAIDNMNGVELLSKTLRVDHKDRYLAPRKSKKELEEMKKNGEEEDRSYRPGRAYENKEIEGKFTLHHGFNIFNPDMVKPSEDEIRQKIMTEEIEKERVRRQQDEEKQRFEEFSVRRREINRRKLQENKKLATEVNGLIMSWRGRVDPQAQKAKNWEVQNFEVCYFCGSPDHFSKDCPTGGQSSQIAGINRAR